MERTYFIYRHIRLDKNVPFYIGKGVTTPNAKSYKWEYRRAFYGKECRSQYWWKIVNKSGYEAEIIYETNDDNKINEKEKEFIKLYGRADLGLGTLCNLTDGGDGWSNPTPESIKKAVKKRTENGGYENCKISNSTAVYIYNIKGEFIKEFKSIRDLNKATYIDATTVWEYVKTKRSIYGYLLSYKKNLDGIDFKEYKIHDKESRPILQYREDGSSVVMFKARNLALKYIKGSSKGLDRAIELDISYKGFYWKHIDIFEINDYIKHGIKYIR